MCGAHWGRAESSWGWALLGLPGPGLGPALLRLYVEIRIQGSLAVPGWVVWLCPRAGSSAGGSGQARALGWGQQGEGQQGQVLAPALGSAQPHGALQPWAQGLGRALGVLVAVAGHEPRGAQVGRRPMALGCPSKWHFGSWQFQTHISNC